MIKLSLFFIYCLQKKTAENMNILYINIFIILMSRIDPSNMLYILLYLLTSYRYSIQMK